MNRLILISSALLLSSCATVSTLPKYQLGDDYYKFRKEDGHYIKAFVDVGEDTIKIQSEENAALPTNPKKDLLFLKPSFDVDVLVTVFKYRPATTNLPRQLTTDFNGNIYFGYRVDRFKVHNVNSPKGRIRHIRHRAASIGVFGGMGATSISPWTTNQLTTDEYNGFILSRGIALMFGVNNLTVGAGIGWDYLTDRDKDIWIYQNKSWYGLTLSLNLN